MGAWTVCKPAFRWMEADLSEKIAVGPGGKAEHSKINWRERVSNDMLIGARVQRPCRIHHRLSQEMQQKYD